MDRKCPRVSMAAALAVLAGACAAADDSAGPEEESLEDFIASGALFDEERDKGDARRQELETQEAIAACMAEEGFEYVPYVYSYVDSSYGAPETAEERIQEYGLGISYYVLNQESYVGQGIYEVEAGEQGHVEVDVYDLPESGQATAPSGVEEEGDASDLGDGAEHSENPHNEFPNDPNRAIREALSDDELAAYQEALWGVYPETELDTMTAEELEAMSDDELDAMFEEQDALMEGWESGGCYEDANEELWDAGAVETFYEQFGDQMEDIYEEVEADPRIVELDSKWSKCMSGAGYAFDDEEDATSYVVGLLEEVGAVSVPASPQGAWDYEPKPIEAGTDTYREVESIFKEEVAIAETGAKCREGAYEIYETVYKEYEQAFIDNNRAALEQFREENS